MRLKLVTSLPAHQDRAWSVAVHPSLPLLASASSDRTCLITSLRTYAPLSTLDGGHKRSIRAVSWQPTPAGTTTTSSSTLATGSFDATAGIWHRDAGPDWDFTVVLDGHENEVKSVAWSPTGTHLATCSRDKTVWIWEGLSPDTYETVAVLQEHTQDVKCVAWHPREPLLASSSYDNSIRLWREDDGDGDGDWACCAELLGHAGTVWSVAFEPRGSGSGERMASCSDDRSVRVWVRTARAGGPRRGPPSILRGRPVEEAWVVQAAMPPVHARAVYSVSWSGGSGRVASCGGDGRVAVYAEGVAGGGEWAVVAVLEGAHGVYEVNCVAWSKRWDRDAEEEEEVIVSCGDDGAVNVWEVVEG